MAKLKKQLINLLPQQEFAGSTLGRILAWILSTFRIIVVVTEIVVMAAFLSRFYLDARIANLNDEIKVKTAIIQTTTTFEKTFRNTQKKVSIIEELVTNGSAIAVELDTISSLLPPDVTLSSYSYLGGSQSLRALTPNELSISQFISNLKATNKFTNFEIAQISTTDTGGLLNFSLNFDAASNQGGRQ